MVKKSIYGILIIVIVIVGLKKLGIFDPKIVNVDNIIIEKPFLYRNLSNDVQEKFIDHYSIPILFMSVVYKKAVLYSIQKITNKKGFQFVFSLSSKQKVKVDTSSCYIIKKNISFKDLSNQGFLIKQTEIYKYPYHITFNEINDERSKKMINQICKKSAVIKILSSHSSSMER